MTDYTPATEDVRSRYVYAADFTVSEEADAWGEFDRWLAAHDAEVYQRAREDAAEAVAADIRANNSVYDLGDTHVVDLVAAALGNGDCQHDWQHLKGEKCPTCRRCGAARGDGEPMLDAQKFIDVQDGYYEIRDNRIERYAPQLPLPERGRP